MSNAHFEDTERWLDRLHTDVDTANIGCGTDHRDGWRNVDIDTSCEPDLVHDLEETPWPLEDDSYDVLLMDNVIEHIDPAARDGVLRECRRILRGDGKLIMRWGLPGVGGGWDVTHYQFPSWEWPEHPTRRQHWQLLERNFERTTIGKLMPMPIARQLAWHGWRMFLGVEVIVSPTNE